MKSSSMRNLVVGTLGMLLLIAARANPARAAGDQVVGSGTGHGLVKLAGIQFAGKKGQKDENIRSMTRMIRQAAVKGAQVIVTPEMALSGFMNTAAEKQLAEPIPGPSTKIFGDLAKELDLHILLGMPEKRGDDFSNAVAIIGRDGQVNGVYRKIVMNCNEAATGCLAGDHLDVWRFETETGAMTAGINICADIGNPEHARVPTLKGADVILHPLGSYPGNAIHRSMFITRAYENGIYIFLVNHAAPRMNGTSMVSSYQGNIMAEAGTAEEVFFFEMDIDALNRHRAISGDGKQLRRPELYSVLTDPVLQIHPLNANLPLSSKQYRGIMVDHRPDILILSVKEKSIACPEILLRSTDGQPFAITGFQSPENCITADYDPAVRGTKFVLHPQADPGKLKQGVQGQIKIRVTHPKSDTVDISFDTRPLFASEPARIVIDGAQPGEPVIREVIVRHNYNQYFELPPAHRSPGSSRKGFMQLVNLGPAGNSWKLNLAITPPERQGDEKMFTDVLVVQVKGGQKLEIPCVGNY